MCEQSDLPLTWPQLEHAIKRNFGGLESKELNPYKEFQEVIPMSRDLPEDVPEEASIYGYINFKNIYLLYNYHSS